MKLHPTSRIGRLLAAAALSVGLCGTAVTPAGATSDALGAVPLPSRAVPFDAPTMSTVSSAEQDLYLGVSATITNRTGEPVALAFVPDGRPTGTADEPIIVMPGAAVVFTHGLRDQTGVPEVRVRVHAMIGDFVGPMQQILKVSNTQDGEARIAVDCMPRTDRGRTYNDQHSHDYSQHEDAHQDSRGQATYGYRAADTAEHQVLEIQLHRLCPWSTQDYGDRKGL